MKLEKNWFYSFCFSLSIIGMLYIIVCGFDYLGKGQEYPYFPKGLLILGFFAIWMLMKFLAALFAKLQVAQKLAVNKRWVRIIEAIFVVLVLAAAFIVRAVVIREIPMQPESDYKTYYEIAGLLKDGTIQKLGKGYCDYIAMFPHVMGYCYLLKIAFMWFGTSVEVGQYLNIILSVATVFFIYRIGKKLGGRITGFICLLASAFWPSQVLYITMLSSEYVFTFFLFGCIWLFLSIVKDYDGNTKHPTKGVILHVVLGILIAITAAIRPMALILLVAIIICIFPQKMKLSNIHRNDLPLMLRILEKGWLRCVIIIVSYMILSGVITTNIELEVDRTLPSASASFGYNLLVGLNTDSIGGWNEEDAALLYSSMEETGSATQAHITCRDLAVTRLTTNLKGMLNLFVNKYELLWGNDDYGSTWNIAFLEEQGELTDARSDFLYTIRDYNDIIYIVTVFFSIIALVYLWKKEGSFAYLLILLYLGTVAMHLFVESQNRYHYFVLQIFMILAAMGINFLFQDGREHANISFAKKQAELDNAKREQEELESLEAIEEVAAGLSRVAMTNIFDMDYALKNGHVIMTVSQAYANKPEEMETTVGEMKLLETQMEPTKTQIKAPEVQIEPPEAQIEPLETQIKTLETQMNPSHTKIKPKVVEIIPTKFEHQQSINPTVVKKSAKVQISDAKIQKTRQLKVTANKVDRIKLKLLDSKTVKENKESKESKERKERKERKEHKQNFLHKEKFSSLNTENTRELVKKQKVTNAKKIQNSVIAIKSDKAIKHIKNSQGGKNIKHISSTRKKHIKIIRDLKKKRNRHVERR